GRARNSAPRRLWPQALDAIAEIGGGSPNRIGRHQRIAGRARLAAPASSGVRGARWRSRNRIRWGLLKQVRQPIVALLGQALLSEALLREALLSQALLSQALLSQALLSQALLSQALLSQALAHSRKGQESCGKPWKDAFLQSHESESLVLPGRTSAATVHRITNNGFSLLSARRFATTASRRSVSHDLTFSDQFGQ